MRLTVVGSAGSYGSAGVLCSSYLVQSGETSLLMDIGNGSFSALAKIIEPGEIDAVFISHRHHDHLADLISLYHYLLFVPGARIKRTRLLASAETFEAMAAIFGVKLEAIFELEVVAPENQINLGPLRMDFARADHIAGTLSCKVTEERDVSLGYTADTGFTASLAEFFYGVEILIGESTWVLRPERVPKGSHMAAAELGEMANAARVKRLIVSHVAFPGTAKAAAELVRTTCKATVIAAKDGLVVEI